MVAATWTPTKDPCEAVKKAIEANDVHYFKVVRVSEKETIARMKIDRLPILRYAAANGKKEIFDFLKENKWGDCTPSQLINPALCGGNLEIIKCVLNDLKEENTNVMNIRFIDNKNILHVMSEYKHNKYKFTELMKLLTGCNEVLEWLSQEKDIQDNNGNTLLHITAMAGNLSGFRYFAEILGCSLDVMNIKGEKPLDLIENSSENNLIYPGEKVSFWAYKHQIKNGYSAVIYRENVDNDPPQERSGSCLVM